MNFKSKHWRVLLLVRSSTPASGHHVFSITSKIVTINNKGSFLQLKWWHYAYAFNHLKIYSWLILSPFYKNIDIYFRPIKATDVSLGSNCWRCQNPLLTYHVTSRPCAGHTAQGTTHFDGIRASHSSRKGKALIALRRKWRSRPRRDVYHPDGFGMHPDALLIKKLRRESSTWFLTGCFLRKSKDPMPAVYSPHGRGISRRQTCASDT